MMFELALCAIVPLILANGPLVKAKLGLDIAPLVVPLTVLWGLAYALPFYIPPGEFAMQARPRRLERVTRSTHTRPGVATGRAPCSRVLRRRPPRVGHTRHRHAPPPRATARAGGWQDIDRSLHQPLRRRRLQRLGHLEPLGLGVRQAR